MNRGLRFRWWTLFGLAAVSAAIVAYVRIPRRTKTAEAHTTLQSGLKMDVRFTQQSPWGWATPNRLISMGVSIGGKDVPVAKEAYEGLQTLDLTRKPFIAETNGFPEVIVIGRTGSPVAEAHWRFLNYSFSELIVIGPNCHTTTYFASTLPTLKQVRLTPPTIVLKQTPSAPHCAKPPVRLTATVKIKEASLNPSAPHCAKPPVRLTATVKIMEASLKDLP